RRRGRGIDHEPRPRAPREVDVDPGNRARRDGVVPRRDGGGPDGGGDGDDVRDDRQRDEDRGDDETAGTEEAGHGESERPAAVGDFNLPHTRRPDHRRRDAGVYSSTGRGATDIAAENLGRLSSAGCATTSCCRPPADLTRSTSPRSTRM